MQTHLMLNWLGFGGCLSRNWQLLRWKKKLAILLRNRLMLSGAYFTVAAELLWILFITQALMTSYRWAGGASVNCVYSQENRLQCPKTVIHWLMSWFLQSFIAGLRPQPLVLGQMWSAADCSVLILISFALCAACASGRKPYWVACC